MAAGALGRPFFLVYRVGSDFRSAADAAGQFDSRGCSRKSAPTPVGRDLGQSRISATLSRFAALVESAARFGSDPMLHTAIVNFDRALRTLTGLASSVASCTWRGACPMPELTEGERRLSAGLMRVNHTGEVCAQALYSAQAVVSRDSGDRGSLRRRRARGGGASRVDAAASRRARRPPVAAQSALVRGLVCHRRGRRASSATASTWASSSKPSARSRSTSPRTSTDCRRATRRAARSSTRCARTKRGTARWRRKPARSGCRLRFRR